LGKEKRASKKKRRKRRKGIVNKNRQFNEMTKKQTFERPFPEVQNLVPGEAKVGKKVKVRYRARPHDKKTHWKSGLVISVHDSTI